MSSEQDKREAMTTRLYIDSIERTHRLCDDIIEAVRTGGDLIVLDVVGDFLNAVDGVDEDAIKRWDAAREAALRRVDDAAVSGPKNEED